ALAVAAAAAALGPAACTGQIGTIALDVVTAPGDDVLDRVDHVRLILSNPYTVVEAERGADGHFDLELDVIADGPSGSILLLGYDADDAIVAYGRTPPLPIAAIDADLRVYVAAPDTLAEAPVALDAAVSEVGAGLLDYGVLLAGGRDATGAPVADVVIYNAYGHELQRGEDLPAPRAGVAVGTSTSGYAYVFGGTDADGDPRGTFWRFDTTIAPAGLWDEAADMPDLARAGAAMAPLGGDAFLMTGAPPVLLEGLQLRATGFDDPTSLGGLPASVQRTQDPGAPIYTLIVGDGAGPEGVMRLADGALEAQSAPADALRSHHALVTTADDRMIAIAGAGADAVPLRSAIVCDPAQRSYTSQADVLTTGRLDAAVAATATYILVAGGRDADGNVLGDAELLDPDTLAHLGTIPMVVPRTGAVARPLPNQQVLIAGGLDADGQPVDLLELYTPPPPDLP
ncbi:MAG: hypothetical protein KC464_30110, partial [Myxococcales bacterium]|nr:hypothetical protein [Myxococcales bacterium]